MRLNVIDPVDLTLSGVVTQFESVQWNYTFNTSDGTFQIDCSTEYFQLLKEGRIVENSEVLDHAGVIKKVTILQSNEKESLQVSGIMLEKEILYSRVLKAYIVYQALYPTTVLRSIVEMSLTNPAEASRKYLNLGNTTYPEDSLVPDMEKTDYSSNYANLGDEVYTLLSNADIGVKAYINHSTNLIDLEFYTGKDRTFGSDDSIIFATDRGTALSTTYSSDSSQNINTIIVIGEDDVRMEASRQFQEGESLIEKSVDVSGELPWPTYKKEIFEEGGEYYRYKKYTPTGEFVTNRDAWEKWSVDRIETQETRYREVQQEVSTEISEEELLSNAELLGGYNVDSKEGVINGSSILSSTALSYGKQNATVGSPVYIGSLQKSLSSKVALYSQEDSEVVEPKATVSPLKSSSVSSNNNVSGKTSYGLNRVPIEDTSVNFEVEKDESGDTTIKQYETVIEEYQVTIVTYEVKDFLEYVYVNYGDPPSEATVIVQGSMASGDVIYRENFEEIKIEESKYREILFKKAQSYLKTFVVSESIEVEPYSLSREAYNKDYFVGDIITARNKNLGYSTDLRITGASEVWDSTGHKVTLNLGTDVPTLTERIKFISQGGV